MSLLDAYSGLAESVTWRHATDIDQYGDPTYTDTIISVIWFDQQRIRYAADNTELVCDAYCLVDPAYALVLGDAILRGGLTWPIASIEKTPGFSGTQFLDVSLMRS
jgi:hypothetical protein